MFRAEGMALAPLRWMRAGFDGIRHRMTMVVAGVSLAAILSHLALRLATGSPTGCLVPLYAGLFLGGTPALYGIFERFSHGSFVSPLVEGTVLATSVLMEWYLAATFLVAMAAMLGWLHGEGGAALARIVHPAASPVGHRLHQARHRLLSKCWLGSPHAGICHKRKRSFPR
jgi:hypothetical protein